LPVSYPRIVVDTGPLVEYLSATPLGQKFRVEVVESDVVEEVFVSETTVAEVYYVLCRQLGARAAESRTTSLLRYVGIVEGRETQLQAGRYKCERALALSDCFTLAAAKRVGAPALFRREAEVAAELAKKPLDVKVIWLNDV